MKCRIQIPSIVQTMIFSVLEISLRFFTLPLLSDVSCVNASKETSKSSASVSTDYYIRQYPAINFMSTIECILKRFHILSDT